uniref:Caspase family p20 domain-containing protein n=1 Tax=Xiphophorus couchianus TaxID=32473 RepID=A0A3B5LKK1_9TELE
LLDGLLHDGVLNDGEKDAVVEENDSRALGLSNVQPAQPASAGLVAQSGSTPSVSSVEEFWKSKKDDPEVYPVTQTSLRNRVALLITNIKFSEKSMNRSGAEKGEENMEKLLSNLGYEVVKYTNLTGKAIDEALIHFTKKHTDSAFVVIMSHGKLGKILGVDWKEDKPDEFPIDNIFKHSYSCPELIDKPKVIFIQACRGERRGSVLVNDSPNTAAHVSQPEDLEADELQFVQRKTSFLFFPAHLTLCRTDNQICPGTELLIQGFSQQDEMLVFYLLGSWDMCKFFHILSQSQASVYSIERFLTFFFFFFFGAHNS